jgi:hypothetical protein
MQLVFGPLRDLREDTRDVSWRAVREAEPDLMQLFGFQLGLAAASATLVLWLLAIPVAGLALDGTTLVICCLALAPLHELGHAAAFPHATDADRTILEFRPLRLILRAHYTGVLSRNRCVVLLAMPLLALSLAPIGASAILGIAPSEAVVISIFNALVSGGDVLAAILLLAQVPAGALVRMERERTVWKPSPLAGTLSLRTP